MTDDSFMDEIPIPAEPHPTGIEQLDRIEALEAQVLALQALVHMLVERDISGSSLGAEQYVNSNCASLFGRMMHAPRMYEVDDKVQHSAEMIAGNLIEQLGRDQQLKTSN